MERTGQVVRKRFSNARKRDRPLVPQDEGTITSASHHAVPPHRDRPKISREECSSPPFHRVWGFPPVTRSILRNQRSGRRLCFGASATKRSKEPPTPSGRSDHAVTPRTVRFSHTESARKEVNLPHRASGVKEGETLPRGEKRPRPARFRGGEPLLPSDEVHIFLTKQFFDVKSPLRGAQDALWARSPPFPGLCHTSKASRSNFSPFRTRARRRAGAVFPGSGRADPVPRDLLDTGPGRPDALARRTAGLIHSLLPVWPRGSGSSVR